MCLFGFILSFLFIPRASEVENLKLIQPRPRTKDEIFQTFNPMHVFCQFAYPKVILAVCMLTVTSWKRTDSFRILLVVF